MSPGKSIGNYVHFFLLMFDNIRKLFKELNSFDMPLVELALFLEIFKRLVITMNHKFFGIEVVAMFLKLSPRNTVAYHR